MKIKESKSIIIESDNAPLKISGRDGLSAYRVAKFHEKDNENIKHAVYRTPGGAYYNRYYVKDIYGDEDELGNKGAVGPFTSEEDAVARLKDYKKDVVKESYRRRIRESKEIDRKALVSLVKLGRNPYDGYSILNDGYFVKRIYAESDEDAIRQFRDYLARKNEGLNRKRSIKELRRVPHHRIFKESNGGRFELDVWVPGSGGDDDRERTLLISNSLNEIIKKAYNTRLDSDEAFYLMDWKGIYQPDLDQCYSAEQLEDDIYHIWRYDPDEDLARVLGKKLLPPRR